MKKLSIIASIVFSLVVSGNLFAAEYVEGEVIVKFRAGSAMSAVYTENEDESVMVAVDNTEQAVNNLKNRADVEYVEPNYIVYAEEVPTDWAYNENTEWEDVELPKAWNLTEPAAEVVVAVIDSGVDLDHPELVDALVPGKSFVAGFATPTDDAGHGTRVAGIIAAKGNNGANGMAGVAWDINVKIMPLKFMYQNGTSTTGKISDAVAAIRYAVDNGAHVINASWGFSSYSSSLRDAINYARANGVLFICSAGNSGADNDVESHYPSNYNKDLDNVIAVAAMNRNGDLASFSNYGYYSVDVAAPGEGLKTTDNDGGYKTWASGTSYAAPFVSAIAAMVISEHPTVGYQDLRDRLVKTTKLEDSYSKDLAEAGGCINAYNAIMNINIHDVVAKDGWSAPEAQNADASALVSSGDDSDSGYGCFIGSVENNLLMAGWMLISFALAIPRKRK